MIYWRIFSRPGSAVTKLVLTGCNIWLFSRQRTRQGVVLRTSKYLVMHSTDNSTQCICKCIFYANMQCSYFIEVRNINVCSRCYNSVQMSEPFQGGNPNSFGKISLNWFFMLDFQKHIHSISLWLNHSGKKIGPKFGLLWKLFSFSTLKLGFWTNMESSAAVTLHFEDLVVQN